MGMQRNDGAIRRLLRTAMNGRHKERSIARMVLLGAYGIFITG